MTVHHTYSDADFFRESLAGTAYASGWTSDAAQVLVLLERASIMIDDFVGNQSFGPTTQTRSYDIGTGPLVYDSRPWFPSSGGIETTRSHHAALPLDRWLLSATTVTSYSGTSRATSETLTEGLSNDYLLEPYQANDLGARYWRLKLTTETTKAFNEGQQTITIAGVWGWSQDTAPSTTTLSAAITSTTATTVAVTSGAVFGPGNTIIVGSEGMYVRSISSNDLTVLRGVNGTTAATHSDASTVARYEYPSDVVSVCSDVARVLYRDRDLGVTETLGSGEAGIRVRSRVEIMDAIRTLDHYRVSQASAGLIF
jgi:hypothetical protein